MPIPPPGREDQSQGCPTCRSSLIGDVDKGELVCSKCGLVIQEGVEDRGPEWKALDFEDKQKRIRVGAPTTLALHDYGLTTEIGNTRKDSHGRSLDTFNRNAAEKMRKWQARIRTSSSAERSLSNVLSRITAVCQAMNLPRNERNCAALYSIK